MSARDKALGPDLVLVDGALCHAPKEFDEWDEGIIHDVMGNERLAKPVQALLITYRQIKLSQESFGQDFTNTRAAVDALMPLLAALRKAVREQWEEER